MIFDRLYYVSWVALLVLVASGCQARAHGNLVCFEKKCYQVEVVSHDADRARGLQNRTELPSNAGMLFIFPNSAEHSFWMKDTLIPLDMIWLDYARRVVHIETDVPPCRQDPCATYSPMASALYVLELNAGEAGKRGIALGDEASFKLNAYLK